MSVQNERWVGQLQPKLEETGWRKKICNPGMAMLEGLVEVGRKGSNECVGRTMKQGKKERLPGLQNGKLPEGGWHGQKEGYVDRKIWQRYHGWGGWKVYVKL